MNLSDYLDELASTSGASEFLDKMLKELDPLGKHAMKLGNEPEFQQPLPPLDGNTTPAATTNHAPAAVGSGLLPPKPGQPEEPLPDNIELGLAPVPEGMGYEEAIPYSAFYRGDPAKGLSAKASVPFLEAPVQLQTGRQAPLPQPFYGQNFTQNIAQGAKVQSGIAPTNPYQITAAVMPTPNAIGMPPVHGQGVQAPGYNPPNLNAQAGGMGKWLAEHKSGVEATMSIAGDTIAFINRQRKINEGIASLQSQAKGHELTARGNWANAGVDAMAMRQRQAYAASSMKASNAGSGIAMGSQSVQAIMNTTSNSFERDMAVNTANALNQYNQTRYQAKIARWQAKQLDDSRGVGQFIGSTIGAVAGAFIGAPQLGAAAGGAVGGFLDQ